MREKISMNIFVTGATGFLGQFLVKALKNQGHHVVGIGSKDCDLTSSDSLKTYNHISFDQIYHLACWVQAGDFHLYHSGDIWTKNQLINTHVLSWWKNHQPQAKLIATGTSCSYDPEMALVEDNYLVGTPLSSLFPYAMTKRMLLIGLEALNKQYEMNYLYLVPSTLYGPGYHTDQRQLHFIFDLMRKIYRAKMQDIPAVLWGDGHQKRELIHAEDFVNYTLHLAKTKSNQVINIGAGKEYSIREFARMICQAIDYDFEKIQYDTSKFVGAKSKCLDIQKLKAYCPETQTTPLEKGLKDTMQWFEAHQHAFV